MNLEKKSISDQYFQIKLSFHIWAITYTFLLTFLFAFLKKIYLCVLCVCVLESLSVCLSACKYMGRQIPEEGLDTLQLVLQVM